MQERNHCPNNRVHPTNPFLEFRKEEIERSLSGRFERQVAKYPERLAVKSRQHKLTYSELNQTANRVARAILLQCGAGNEPIALLVEFGAHEIIGFLGILKTGKALVAMSPLYPKIRNSYILEHSETEMIITDNSNLSMAKELAGSRMLVVNLDDLGPGLSGENLDLPISPDTIAAIIYTSGTTGQPKGVIQTHRNLLYNMLIDTNCYQICADDREANLLSYAFFGGLTIVLHCLLNGACVFPFNLKEEGLSRLASFLIENDITIFAAVPTTFRNFIGSLREEEKFPSIRLMRLFGEVVYPKDVEMYKRHFAPCCLFSNTMGSTETGAISLYLMDKEAQIKTSVVPVGYEHEGMHVLLLDEFGNDVGINRVGDVVIKSSYLFPGYWKQPEQTKAAFLPDPAGSKARLYRMGDLGLRLPDGCILNMGRKDSQVKIRGHRVEVAEIEIALLALDGIKEATVIAQEDQYGDKILVAYFVSSQHPAPSISALRRWLAERLPNYMIPTDFVMLGALPLTQTGKVCHHMLPAPSSERPHLDNEIVAPRDCTEMQLIEIWEEVLGIDTIGIEDNFFDLGGNSLLAARLLVRIENAFCKRLPLATIFQRPTVEQISGILQNEDHQRAWSSLVPVQSGGFKMPFFCMAGVNILTDIAHYLGTEQPVYGLVPLNWENEQKYYARIEQMATRYLQEIRALQPEGPYFLGGHSFGGLVAFEMAHQLQMQGQKVGLLVLIDTYPSIDKSIKYYLHRLRYSLKHGQLVDVLVSRVKLLLPITPADVRNKRYWASISRAMDNYKLRAYFGRIVFFAASELLDPSGILKDTRLDWSNVAKGELETYLVPGDHSTLLKEPNLRILAEKLKACLDEAASYRGIETCDG